VVGDSDQCFPPDVEVATPYGPRPISEIAEGDEVIGGTVVGVREGRYHGPLVEIAVDGRRLAGTPAHKIPALECTAYRIGTQRTPDVELAAIRPGSSGLVDGERAPKH